MNSTADLIDTALDRMLLGYGNLGLVIRRRLGDWPADPPRMDGQLVLITGATSGIGLAAAKGFTALGATVAAVARTHQRAREAVQAVRRAVPGADVQPWACDISSMTELRRLTERVADTQPRLDVLVNNAGVMPAQRERSVDGHELMFASHVLAPFALTAWLTDPLKRSAPSRVINVSSGGMYAQALPAEDLQSDQDSFGPKKLYARTKREQMVITEQWAERLKGTGVVVHCMHPGWVDTTGVQNWMPMFRRLTRPILRTPEQGADTIVWLGAAPEALRTTGLFWHDRHPRPTHYRLGAGEESARDRQRLWDLCESLVAGAGARNSLPGD